MNALDNLDLSKAAGLVGMDQATAKTFVRGAMWQLFDANASHVLFHIGWITLKVSDIRPALALLIGSEPTLPAV